MKKFLFSFFILFSVVVSAQTKLGLKLAPIIVSNRVANDAQTADRSGSAFNLSIGLVVDQPLSDTYMFSSGLVYLPKRAAFKDSDLGVEEEYKVQYLQIPATLKLFTNEVAPDFKVFFQVGGGLEIKVFDESEDPTFTTINSFNPIDFSVILGTGVEYRAGLSTTLFGGISYQRGLSNVINEAAVTAAEDLAIRATVVSIDVGVKF